MKESGKPSSFLISRRFYELLAISFYFLGDLLPLNEDFPKAGDYLKGEE